MDKRHRSKKSHNTQQFQEAQILPQHIKFDDVIVPQINEPNPVCEICGEPIKAIIEAISESNGGYSHFDCVLKKLKEQFSVEEPSKISYIGHGTFAVVSPDGKGNYTIGERIQYESQETYTSMKKYVEEQKQ